jgi:hypothetical protein
LDDEGRAIARWATRHQRLILVYLILLIRTSIGRPRRPLPVRTKPRLIATTTRNEIEIELNADEKA